MSRIWRETEAMSPADLRAWRRARRAARRARWRTVVRRLLGR